MRAIFFLCVIVFLAAACRSTENSTTSQEKSLPSEILNACTDVTKTFFTEFTPVILCWDDNVTMAVAQNPKPTAETGQYWVQTCRKRVPHDGPGQSAIVTAKEPAGGNFDGKSGLLIHKMTSGGKTEFDGFSTKIETNRSGELVGTHIVVGGDVQFKYNCSAPSH